MTTKADLDLAAAQAATLAAQVADTAVSNAAVTLKAANTARRRMIIQNGVQPIRVAFGEDPTTTKGLRLIANERVVLEYPFCPLTTVRAIKEGATDSSASVLEWS